jgi:hypothetical protein
MDYDPKDAGPPDQSHLESYEGAVSGPLWQNTALIVGGARLSRRKELFVRVNPTTPENSRVTDLGRLHVIASTAAVAGTELGAIYAYYSISFASPQRSNLRPMLCTGSPVTWDGTSANAYNFFTPTVTHTELTGSGLRLHQLNSSRYTLRADRSNVYYRGTVRCATNETADPLEVVNMALYDQVGAAPIASVSGVNDLEQTSTSYLDVVAGVRHHLIEFSFVLRDVHSIFVGLTTLVTAAAGLYYRHIVLAAVLGRVPQLITVA